METLTLGSHRLRESDAKLNQLLLHGHGHDLSAGNKRTI